MALETHAAEKSPPPPHRGSLRVYLGAAPGVGKTFSMLSEARRRRQRGADVVVGFVETYGRERTDDQLRELEVLPRRHADVDGVLLEDLDLDGVLRRRPQVCLVDELAHRNAPGGRHEHRWEDVEDLLAAGIDVITTLNVSHLESVSDVVERITGVREHERIPDTVVRAADQVELVDSTPEALRRRLAHGNIFSAEEVDASTAAMFEPSSLAALRELALLWVADQVDASRPRDAADFAALVDTRERVVVAVTGAPGTEALVRRAARIAQRARGSFVGVHVTRSGDRAGPEATYTFQRLVTSLGGEFHEVAGDDVASAIVAFAHAQQATQLVVGATNDRWWRRATGRSVVARVVKDAGPVDVHVVSRETRRLPSRLRLDHPRSSALPLQRVAAGFAVAVVGVPLLTAVLAQLDDRIGLPTVLLLFLALVVATSTVGGLVPAVVAAVLAFLSANWFFTPPFHHLTIAEGDHVVALVVFLGVAVVVSRFVASAARRAIDAERARGEAQTLAGLAGSVVASDPLPALLDHLRSVFGFEGAAVLIDEGGQWAPLAESGEAVGEPQREDVRREIAAGTILVARGGRLTAEDHRVLNAFAARLAGSVEHQRLAAEAARAGVLAEANALRAALLQAVSHDLRTPLASIKASATSLLQDDVEWSKDEAREFIATIDDEADRLTALVGNLLDMSRIQAGVVEPVLRPVHLEEILPAAVLGLHAAAGSLLIDVSDTLPPVLADAALLERVLANIIQNAVRYSPVNVPARVDANAAHGSMTIRVVDRGPGIPRTDRARVLQPFQRLDDNRASSGVGLGLAVANGFVRAMGGELEIEDTPGGGTTMLVRLRLAP